MKKILVIITILMISIVGVSYSKTTKTIKNKEDKIAKQFRNKLKKYELEAVIKTNKGDISLFLYPEAAPLNVANFVFLAQNKFYDGISFHRVINNILIQSGDPTGTGIGNSGYLVKDEFVDWLNFASTGVLAMANTGENTNSSQFFITLSPLEQFNKKYTVIGEIKSKDDISVLRLIKEDDRIISVEIKGKNANQFLANFKSEVSTWSKGLREAYPNRY